MYTKEFRKEKLSGWGNYPQHYGYVFRPERIADLSEVLNREEISVLARGGGTSYGDASINGNGLTIDTTRLNKLLHFDPSSGILHCQSGVTLQHIIRTFLQRGWILSVTPGTQFGTIGGCTACDSHGKNWKEGSFSSYIKGFNIMLHDGRVIYCDENNNPAMFYATFGGMGLTGIILDLQIQLKKINSSYIDMESIRFSNLKELFDLISESWDEFDYIFSWIDSHKEGRNMGRGVMQRANHSDNQDLFYSEKKRLAVPLNFPSFAVNRYSVEVFNALYYTKATSGRQSLYIMDFFYPLDGIVNWPRIYGKKGFLEYQIAVPRDNAYEIISKILNIITKSKLGSIVAAVKPIIKSKGLLSFPIDGFTLAVDFSYSEKLWKLLDELDGIVIENGGRVYLSKDARLSGANFRKMYSESLDTWESARNEYKSTDRFCSSLFDRLRKE